MEHKLTLEDLNRGDIFPSTMREGCFEVVIWRVGGAGGPTMKTYIADTYEEAKRVSEEVTTGSGRNND